MSREDVEIRRFEAPDAAGAADLHRRISPEVVMTAELLLHLCASLPARAHAETWVAAEGEKVVGLAEGRLRWRAADSGIGIVRVWVAEERRGRGLGGMLLGLAEEHLVRHGAHRLRSSVGPDPAGRRFAERHGYRRTRSERFWTLDPRAADLSELPSLEAARLAEGYRLVPLRELLDRRHDLHALYEATEDDIPSDDPRSPLAFEEWEPETLGNPLLDPDGSITVLAGERPVSFAWLLVDREHGVAEHEMTGTLPELRGRGLARLAKLAAIRWARDHGVTCLLTANDADNAPMLAVNERLGYRPTVVRDEVVKVVRS
ncbi:MAG: GNAT family N-acetyltransferase [Actinobacteria bacterium]|nr:GNAT family N-acetyltransferase [Actinomycetota bacterium]